MRTRQDEQVKSCQEECAKKNAHCCLLSSEVRHEERALAFELRTGIILHATGGLGGVGLTRQASCAQSHTFPSQVKVTPSPRSWPLAQGNQAEKAETAGLMT